MAKFNMQLFVVQSVLIFTYVNGIHDTEILNLYKHTYFGDGTYYGNTENGLCSLNTPNLPPVAYNVNRLVALNAPQMYGSSACGMCLKVNGTGQGLGHDPITGSFIVYVKDLCPECYPGDVDFAVNGDGRWKVSMQAVQCPVTGPIEYTLQGSNDYYIKLQVRNDRMPTTTVKMYQPRHQTWVTLTRTRDGYWQFPVGDSRIDKPIRAPIQLRLYAPNGQVLNDEVSPQSMEYTGVFYGKGVQYALDPNLPSA